MESGDSGSDSPRSSESDVTDDVISLLGRGEKIEAIRLYRNQTGTGLKEAKEAVERIAEEKGIASTTGGGCFGIIILAIAVTAGLLTCTQ